MTNVRSVRVLDETARFRSVVVIVLTLVLAACGGSAPAAAPESTAPSAGAASAAPSDAPGDSDELTTVNFTLNWFPLGDHAAYYLAYDKKYYLERNLLVNILQGSGSGESIRRVDVGQADLGIADSGVIINAIRNGADLRIVGMVWDESALAIHARRDAGIEKFADLNGKLIGAPAADAGRIFFPDIARLNGIDITTVQYVDIQPAAKYGALASGTVDGIFDATTGRPLVAEAVGEENLLTFKFADYGFDMYGHAIFTSNKMLREKPEVVRRFLDASYLAWSEVFADPDAALLVLQKYAPHMDLDQVGANLELVLALMRTERYKSGGIGWVDATKMAATVKMTNETSEAPRDAEPDEVYTMDFFTRHDLP